MRTLGNKEVRTIYNTLHILNESTGELQQQIGSVEKYSKPIIKYLRDKVPRG